MSDPSSDMTADSTAAGLTNATPSSGSFNPPPWAPAPTNDGTANAGLSSAAAGSTAEGRDTYDRVSAQWSKLIAWWSADSDHHGLAWIQPQIAHWQQLATSGYQISMADLLNTKQDLELCISYAVPQGYEDDSSDSDSPLDAGLRAVAAPFKAIGEIAALPFTLPFKLGEAAGKVLGDGGLPDTPTFTVPSWIWWGLGLGAAGAAWMFYKSTQVAVRAAPALLPLVAPEAMPYLAALQAARGTAPAPTAAPATYDPLQVLAAAFGPRGSRALDRLAQIGSAADAGTLPVQQSGDVSATAAAPAAVRRVVQHALDRLPPELGARSYLRQAAASAAASSDDQGPATLRAGRGAQ